MGGEDGKNSLSTETKLSITLLLFLMQKLPLPHYPQCVGWPFHCIWKALSTHCEMAVIGTVDNRAEVFFYFLPLLNQRRMEPGIKVITLPMR